MSMSATFVQVDEAELAGFRADPSSVEVLFQDGPQLPPPFTRMTEIMRQRVRVAGPQQMAEALARLDPSIRQQLEQSLGRLGLTTSALAAGEGGDALLKLMEQRRSRSDPGTSKARAVLSLDKAWHGVHYVLCGEIEPGASLLSQAVLGGATLGDDDEGFSGYGPPRCFTMAQVAELAQALNRPDLEAEAAARFDWTRIPSSASIPVGDRRTEPG
jgi:hypothetical protein